MDNNRATLSRLFAYLFKGFPISLLGIGGLLCVMACSNGATHQVDQLNEQAYAYHYRNLDSTRYYANKALEFSSHYANGRAEALNNLAFVSMAQMDYDKVLTLIGNLEKITDNQIELLVADVQMMRLCQRKSNNKDFYVYREQALHRIRRIEEEGDQLTAHQQMRFAYAYTEFYIVASVYFYYVGLTSKSQDELDRLSGSEYLRQDSAQYLNYLYNVGSGGIVKGRTKSEILQTEFERLVECYAIAHQQHIPFFEAQALQGLSEHLIDAPNGRKIMEDNPIAISLVNTDNMPDSLLAGNLAQRALNIFQRYGDVYQTAGAYRTLAKCYWALDNYNSALICLHNALEADTVIERAPDLVASIREQMSLACSAIDDKPNSDYNRNIYLDMQEQTRQDRMLEARAELLDKSSAQLNYMIVAIVVILLSLIALLVYLYFKRKRTDVQADIEQFMEQLRKWQQVNDANIEQQKERCEEILEDIELQKNNLAKNLRRNLEQRAKLSLVTSVMPLIDRMLHEVSMLSKKGESKERTEYIAELADKINEYNGVLTNWIRLCQGQLNLHIESFALQSLFDIVAKSKIGFQQKGVELNIQSTDIVVKVDKTLTLFMINTLADNARKFTPEGGRVEIYAQSANGYAEISIADTGCGLTDEQLLHIFDHKPITDTSGALQDGRSHGFGLMNCKGIIEKYKKISPFFANSDIGAEQREKGSRFWFRLPLGVARMLIAAVMMATGPSLLAQDVSSKSRQYCDSLYQCNVDGNYSKTLVMADSCIKELNAQYLANHPTSTTSNLLTIENSEEADAAEIKWFKSGENIDYAVILNMRNEIAVAALALHNWKLYEYNNTVYTQLFRLYSADRTLDDYVKVLQKSDVNKNVAIIILILLLLVLFPVYYIFYYRYRIAYRLCLNRMQLINDVLLADGSTADKLQKIGKIWVTSKAQLNSQVQQLDNFVNQIQQDLSKQIAWEEQQSDTIDLQLDELNRLQYETARLYVSNSVLDNCLSTLKHETMYYPSRIKQMVEVTPIDSSALSEVAGYYKSLYGILSEQAMRQIELPMRIDSEMWNMLLDVLSSINGKKVSWTTHDVNSRYQHVLIPMPCVKLTDDECSQLFTPLTIDVRYLLCRQIIRELGEVTQARASGIKAEMADVGITVCLVIPRNVSYFNVRKEKDVQQM